MDAMERAGSFLSINALGALAKAALDKNFRLASYACITAEDIVKVHPDHPEVARVAKRLLNIALREARVRFNATICYDGIVSWSVLGTKNKQKFADDVPKLLRLLRVADEDTKSMVVMSLQCMGDERVREPLELLFARVQDAGFRYQINEVLSRLDSEQVGEGRF